ncbi:MAG TPA: hypothetical protein VG733_02790 [Chthoniobacteraceae bacterium]|nr:hypothetical protein [Chthoniobacteraceae bacterium]
MNEMIELHDSKLVAVSWADGVAVVMLSPAIVHRSEGRPGVDAGTVWWQAAMFTFRTPLISAHGELPVPVRSGSLHIGDEEHNNMIPATGVFTAAIKLNLDLTDRDHLIVTADQLLISLTGDAHQEGKFEPASKSSHQ